MSKIRDGNHTIRYNVLVAKRLYRGHLRGEMDIILAALSDVVNSLIRSVLGFSVVLLTVLANLCIQMKKKCYRREIK